MGFLKLYGRLLDFGESKEYFNSIRERAVDCIIEWIESTKTIKCCPKFGYEVEYVNLGGTS
jgi:hypothetical protein